MTSKTLIANGRAKDAVYALRKIMPDSEKDDSIPYSSEAVYALANAMELYSDPGTYVADKIFDSEAPIKALKTTPDGTKLATIDACNHIHIWDIETEKEVFSRTIDANNHYNEIRSFILADDQTIVFNDNNQIVKYNFTDNTETVILSPVNSEKHTGNLYRFGEANIFALFTKDGFELYDITTYNCISSHTFSEYGLSKEFTTVIIHEVALSDDGNELIFTVDKGSEDHLTIAVYDISADSLHSFAADFDSCKSMVSSGDNLYVAAGISPYTDPDSTYVTSIDLNTGSVNWKTITPGLVYNIELSYNSDLLFCATLDYMNTLSIADGKILQSLNTSGVIRTMYPTTGNSLKFFTDDSNQYLATTDLSSLGYRPVFNNKPDLVAENFYYVNDRLFVMFRNASYISAFKEKPNENEFVVSLPYSLTTKMSDTVIIQKSNLTSNTYDFYSLESDEPILSIPKYYVRGDFVGDGSKYFADYGLGLNVYDLSNGSLVKEIPMNNCAGFGNNALSNDGEYLMSNISNERQLYLYSIETLNVEAISKPDIPVDEDIEVFNLDKDNYAIRRASGVVEFYKRDSREPYMTTSRTLSANLDAFKICHNSNVLSIAYSDGSIEFYRFGETTELIKTIYDVPMSTPVIHDFNYYADSHMYVLVLFDIAYILNDDLETVTVIPEDVYYVPSKDYFIYYSDDAFYAIPHYSYDDLIKLSDEFLGDYLPPKSIIAKYGIVQ